MSGFKIIFIFLTFICFVVWLGTDLLRTQSSVEVTPQLTEALTPLNPNLDQDTLARVRSLDDRARLVAATPRPSTAVSTPIPTPVLTTPIPSASPQTENSATPEANINVLNLTP